jgi:exopolyphosphatase/guanosine-5'-triphosphate,3'-diphosphate pyrophosphatase
MRVAGLDLGTNTFLCLIADVDPATGAMHVIQDEVRIVRLGQGVNATKELHPEALARAEEAFVEFQKFIHAAKCEQVLAVATSATRDAKNGHLLVEMGKRYGIPIEVISGEKEAELTFQGSIEPSWAGLTAVIDVGGGSSEIIFGDRNGILIRFSANVGSVRLTEKYITGHPIAERELLAVTENVRQEMALGMKAALSEFNNRHLSSGGVAPEAPLDLEELLGRTTNAVAVAGTPTTLAAVQQGQAFVSENIHGHVIAIDELHKMIADLASMTVAQRGLLAGMEPKRADVIVAGAICLCEAARLLRTSALQVSIRGVRYGVAMWCSQRITQ